MVRQTSMFPSQATSHDGRSENDLSWAITVEDARGSERDFIRDFGFAYLRPFLSDPVHLRPAAASSVHLRPSGSTRGPFLDVSGPPGHRSPSHSVHRRPALSRLVRVRPFLTRTELGALFIHLNALTPIHHWTLLDFFGLLCATPWLFLDSSGRANVVSCTRHPSKTPPIPLPPTQPISPTTVNPPTVLIPAPYRA